LAAQKGVEASAGENFKDFPNVLLGFMQSLNEPADIPGFICYSSGLLSGEQIICSQDQPS
jgi:hypothetical protein